MPIYGINGRILLTHSGHFKYLPETNNINLPYYSKDINATLLSLGNMQRHGCNYHTHDNNKISIYLPDNILHETATMIDNNTYLMNTTTIPIQHPPTSPIAYVLASRPSHVNQEQRRRCDLVQELLVALSFPSDRSLCDDLSHGKITSSPYSSLTPHDVRLNRLLRGPCPHAAAGKHRSAPHPPSLSPPATSPGDLLGFDIHLLPCPSTSGFTHRCTIVDEHSGLVGEIGLRTKSTPDVFAGLMAYIHDTFTANGNKVKAMRGDDEAINRSLALSLATEGIKLQLSPAGEHARLPERYVQTEDNRVTSQTSYLPYDMPNKLTLDLHKAIAAIMNDSINSRSHPLTPNEVVTGRKCSRVPISFGSCWNVAMSPLKRRAIATKTSSTIKHVPKVFFSKSVLSYSVYNKQCHIRYYVVACARKDKGTCPATSH